MHDISIGLLWPLFSLITGLIMIRVVKHTDGSPIQEWMTNEWCIWVVLSVFFPFGMVFIMFLYIDPLIDRFSWRAINMFFVKERSIENIQTALLVILIPIILIVQAVYLYLK